MPLAGSSGCLWIGKLKQEEKQGAKMNVHMEKFEKEKKLGCHLAR